MIGESFVGRFREGARARFRQRHRIALLVGRRRIGVHLVEEERQRAGMDLSRTALLAPVMTSSPAGNSFDSTVLPASRERAGFTRSLNAGLSGISGSMRWRELRFCVSSRAVEERSTEVEERIARMPVRGSITTTKPSSRAAKRSARATAGATAQQAAEAAGTGATAGAPAKESVTALFPGAPVPAAAEVAVAQIRQLAHASQTLEDTSKNLAF